MRLMPNRNLVFIFLFFCLALTVVAQDKSDSLLRLLPSAQGPARAKLLNALSKNYWNSDPKRSEEFASQQVKLADSLHDAALQWDAYYNEGVSFFYLSDYPKALQAFLHSLKIAEEQKNKKQIAGSLNSMGSVYQSLDDYPKAMDYFERSLKLREELKDSFAVASTLANMGGMLDYMDRQEEGLKDFKRAMAIWGKMHYSEGLANCYLGIGSIYTSFKKYDSAIVYYKMSAEMK